MSKNSKINRVFAKFKTTKRMRKTRGIEWCQNRELKTKSSGRNYENKLRLEIQKKWTELQNAKSTRCVEE